MNSAEQVLLFLQGEGKDNNGRSILDIWFFNTYELWNDPNYIQWLFPLDKESSCNLLAPVIEREDFVKLRTKEIKKTMVASFNLMLLLYDFAWKNDRIIYTGFNFDKYQWIYPGSYHYLRITRMLRSLNLFGLKYYSSRFLKALEAVYRQYPNQIGSSIDYWRAAVKT